MSNRENSFLAITLGFFVFIADFITKFLTAAHIPLMHGNQFPYGGIGVFKNFLGIEFSIVHAINRGAAWGLFSDYQLYLIVLRIVLIFSLIVYLVFYNKHQGFVIPMTLISAGALGNILDYFLYGHVIDMLRFVLWGYDFPVFNVADSFICIGIFSLMITSWFESKDV